MYIFTFINDKCSTENAVQWIKVLRDLLRVLHSMAAVDPIRDKAEQNKINLITAKTKSDVFDASDPPCPY